MQGKIAMSAQDTISYKEMRPDGICRVTDRFYTKTIQFLDINYQLARNEDKNIIFENYCDFLNYFDTSISVQLSFLNQTMDISEYEKAIDIKSRDDEFNDIREEYTEMLKASLHVATMALCGRNISRSGSKPTISKMQSSGWNVSRRTF